MHNRYRFALLPLAWVVCLVGTLASAQPKQRLALVPTAKALEPLAELLTAALTESKAVDLVERREFGRILAEQELTAADLVDSASRVKIGALLRAKGIVFLETDKWARQIRVRLVETERGFQAGFLQYAKGDDLAKLTKAIAADLNVLTPKLRIDPKKAVLIGVLRAGNATLSPHLDWIEDEVPARLEGILSRDPRVLLVERRRLGELLVETERTRGPGADFLASGILLDAEFTLREGEAISGDDRAVVLHLRLRPPAGTDSRRISAPGSTSRLQALLEKGIAAALRELPKMQQKGHSTTESLTWLKLAERRWHAEHQERPDRTIGPAETAHALAPKDQDARAKLVASLAGEACKSYRGRMKPEEAMRRAKLLARAAALCRPKDARKARKALLWETTSSRPSFLTKRDSKVSPEVRDALRPVRRMLRYSAIEETGQKPFPSPKPKPWSVPQFFDKLECYFDDPFEAAAFAEPRLLEICQAERFSAKQRMQWLDQILKDAGFCGDDDGVWSEKRAEAAWRPVLLRLPCRKQPRYECRVQRALAMVSTDPETMRKHARKALEISTALNSTKEKTGQAGLLSHADVLAMLPKKEQNLLREKAFRSYVDRGDVAGFLSSMACNDGDELVASMPPKAAKKLLDRAIELVDGKAPKREAQHQWYAVSQLRWAKNDLLAKHPELAVGPPQFTPAVLWDRRRDLTKVHKVNRRGLLRPLRLLLDRETLWISFGSTDWGAKRRDVGLARVDLKTRKLVSFRTGHLPGAGEDCWRGDYYGESTQISRLGNRICFGHFDVGVFLFPAAANAIDLSGVDFLNTRNGLPNSQITAAIAVGKDIYVGLGGTKSKNSALIKWNADSNRVSVVASGARTQEDGTLNGGLPWEVHGMLADSKAKFLYLIIGSHHKEKRGGLWKLELATGKWQRLRAMSWAEADRTIVAGDGSLVNCADSAAFRFFADTEKFQLFHGDRWDKKRFGQPLVHSAQLGTSTIADHDGYVWCKDWCGQLIRVRHGGSQSEYVTIEGERSPISCYDMVSSKYGLITIAYMADAKGANYRVLLFPGPDQRP